MNNAGSVLETCITSSSQLCTQQAQVERDAARRRERQLHSRLALMHRLLQFHAHNAFHHPSAEKTGSKLCGLAQMALMTPEVE